MKKVIEIALVGAPNSGKSTFFKALTLKDVKIADYPFTTIEPNEGTGFVTSKCPCKNEKSPDEECGNCLDGVRLVPLKVWDVAGLVKGAHEGRGRGNSFLDNVMQAEGLIHVLDMTGKTDENGEAAEGHDPEETVKMLNEEIEYWMFNLIKKDAKLFSHSKDIVKTIGKRLSGLGINEMQISKSVGNETSFNDEELLELCRRIRKRAKPILIAGNKIDKEDAEKNLGKLKEAIGTSGDYELALREANKIGLIKYIPGSRKFEEIKEAEGRQRAGLAKMHEFLADKSTGVQECMNKLVFDILDYVVVYPVANNDWTDSKGRKLPDALLMRNGSTCVDLAYAIHDDIGKKFITAIDAKSGKTVGGNYVLKDGDVISVRSGK